MAASGTPTSQRTSLSPDQFPSSDEIYAQQGYGSLAPGYHQHHHHPYDAINIKTEPGLLSPEQQQQHNGNPSQQYSDYTLYTATELDTSGDGGGGGGGGDGGGVNPADLSLLNSAHHGSDNHHHAGEPVEWDHVFQHQQSGPWQTHRRAPSEYSEMSSAHSPYLGNNPDCSGHPSPLIGAQHYSGDPQQQGQGAGPMQDLLNAGGDAFGLESFTISDEPSTGQQQQPQHQQPQPQQQQQQQQQQQVVAGSPVPGGYHSEATSPFLSPQDGHGHGHPHGNHLLGHIPPVGLGGSLFATAASPPPPQPQQQQPQQQPPPPPALAGLGIASRESEEPTPQINISFAPPQRQPTFPGKSGAEPEDGALRPPQKCLPPPPCCHW